MKDQLNQFIRFVLVVTLITAGVGVVAGTASSTAAQTNVGTTATAYIIGNDATGVGVADNFAGPLAATQAVNGYHTMIEADDAGDVVVGGSQFL